MFRLGFFVAHLAGGLVYFLLRKVLWPILQYGFRLRGYLSDEEAARWIGRHFPEIQDKLLNALQLEGQNSDFHAAVMLALEERRAVVLRYPWEGALPRKAIRRYGLLLLGLLLVGGVIWLSMPQVVGGGAQRFLQPTKAFIPPLPYTIEVEGLRSFYRKGESLSLTFRLRGTTLPRMLSAYREGGVPLPLERQSPQLYTLSLPVLEKSFTFSSRMGRRRLRVYSLVVQEPPALDKLELLAFYPAYTGKGVDTFVQARCGCYGARGCICRRGYGEMSHTRWFLLRYRFVCGRAFWEATWVADRDVEYPLILRSMLGADTFRLYVEVYPDNYPVVQLFSEDFDPESYMQRVRLRLMDDYGFTRGFCGIG